MRRAPTGDPVDCKHQSVENIQTRGAARHTPGCQNRHHGAFHPPLLPVVTLVRFTLGAMFTRQKYDDQAAGVHRWSIWLALSVCTGGS